MSNDLIVAVQSQAKEFIKVLPESITPDRFVRVVITEMRSNQKLMECEKASVLGSLMQCAELGLVPSKTTGHCYLVPYGKNCNLIVGYKGLIELATRSGEITSIEAHVIREHDDFDVQLGTTKSITHTPNFLEDGNVIGAYAVATFKNGETQFEVMKRSEIDKIRNMSKGGNIWKDHFEEMSKKTAVRRLIKYLPVNPELEKALTIDNAQVERKPRRSRATEMLRTINE